jgi:pilus assembly protein CpaB
MRVLIVGIIVLALAVAGVSTYLIKSFGSKDKVAELQKQAEKPKLRVLIATKALKAGETLAANAMAWQPWVEGALNKQFITVTNEEDENRKLNEFAGGTVRRPIAEGEPILTAKVFKREKPGFLAGLLDSGMRAVSFTVSAETAVAGFILPGDRVDVLLTHSKVREGLQGKVKSPVAPTDSLLVLQQTTETVLKDVRVIAINMAVDLPQPGAIAVPAQTITLELTPKQAELLTTARGMGKLSLVLRSLVAGDTDDKERRPFTTDVEVSPFLSNVVDIVEEQKEKNAQATAGKYKKDAPVKSKAVAKPLPPKETVKIFRGGKGGLSEVTGAGEGTGKSEATKK